MSAPDVSARAMGVMDRRPVRRRMQGVTLVELMVSLVIGLMLIAASLTVYLQSRNTYRTTESAARLQEVGRYALSVLEPDIRSAGFWGLANRPNPFTNTVADAAITNNCGTGWIGDVARPLDAIDGDGTTAAYTLTCTATSRSLTSDVLIVKRADSRTSAPSASNIQIQSNRLTATIFNDSTIPTGFDSASSETRNMVANVYYISNPSTDRFSLRRRTLAGTTIVDEEVVPGVQAMQVQFGIDTNADGTADRYVDPGTFTGTIVSARLWLLIVADEIEIGYTDSNTYTMGNATVTPNDNRRRLLLTKTIQIRNSRP